MKISTTFVVLGLSSMLAISGCGIKGNARCDHAQTKTFNVNISVGNDKSKPPTVDKGTIVACFQDDIIFTANVDDFSITFDKGSPFKGDLESSQGKAIGAVKVDPRKSVRFKYDVIVPGHPKLDPIIIVLPR